MSCLLQSAAGAASSTRSIEARSAESGTVPGPHEVEPVATPNVTASGRGMDLSPHFPPVVSPRPLLSALTSAAEWPMLGRQFKSARRTDRGGAVSSCLVGFQAPFPLLPWLTGRSYTCSYRSDSVARVWFVAV